MSSLCWECKYEHSDCEWDKWIEKVDCPYFSKKLAINYPKKIEELEKKLEQADRSYGILATENEALLLRADRIEAERNELKKRMEEMKYDFDFINSDRNLLKADNEKFKEHIKSLDDIILKLKEENVDLRFETVKAFERGEKFPCDRDCDSCTEKCRAWQNGFYAKYGVRNCERCENSHEIVDVDGVIYCKVRNKGEYCEDVCADFREKK